MGVRPTQLTDIISWLGIGPHQLTVIIAKQFKKGLFLTPQWNPLRSWLRQFHRVNLNTPFWGQNGAFKKKLPKEIFKDPATGIFWGQVFDWLTFNYSGYWVQQAVTVALCHFIEKELCRAPFVPFVANYCFNIITYLEVTPSILFFCIAETTTALKRCADIGAWMMWVCGHPVLFNIRR